MRIDYLIDGYNLMHAAGLARERYGQGDLERCRKRLLNLLRHGLSPEERANTRVVFDGQGSLNSNEPEFQYHGLSICFSCPGEEADDVIEGLIAAHSAPKQLTVISSDHRLHKAAHARRAVPVDAEQFLRQLESVLRSREAGSPHLITPLPEKPQSVDTQAWLTEFGEIDIQHIESVIQAEVPSQEKSRAPNIPSYTPKTQKSSQKPEILPSKEETTTPLSADSQTPLDLKFWENRIAELDQEE